MAKKKTPAWQDSTYQKQISYYKKLLADFLAQETRRKNEVGAYYGTLGTPDKKTAKKKNGKYVYKTVRQKTGKRIPITVSVWDPKAKRRNTYRTTKPEIKTTRVKQYITEKGLDPTEGLYQRELREQRTKDKQDIQSDYGARGLIHSGLYAKKQSDYETEFGKQLAELNRQRSKQYSDIAAEHLAFLREQELQKENARLEAIRRRAAKTGSFLGL